MTPVNFTDFINFKGSEIFMNILKSVLSVGAGLLATAACYLFMSSGKKSDDNEAGESQVNNQTTDGEYSDRPNAEYRKSSSAKSDSLLLKLDKFQVSLINFARFISEVVRAITLFIRATRCYEYDVSYQRS